LAYDAADATATPSSLASLTPRMILPFQCSRLTKALLVNRPSEKNLKENILSLLYGGPKAAVSAVRLI